MEQTRQMGRTLRVTMKSGTDRTINLDHFLDAYPLKRPDGAPNGTRIRFINHDFLDIEEPYESLNTRLMVSEYQRMVFIQKEEYTTAVAPPRSRRELQEEADCDPIFIDGFRGR